MGISTEMQRIKNNINETFTSLSSKDVIVPENANSDNLNALTESIPYYSCPNGTQWTQSNITEGDWHIVYGNGIYVACSTDVARTVLYSTDGITWNASNVVFRIFHTEALKYYNGIWVLSGCYYSTDGMTWINSSMKNTSITNIEYCNGVWICGSYCNALAIYYSTDGMTWQVNRSPIGGRLSYLKNINGIWFACFYNSGKLYYSNDGISWFLCDITFTYTTSSFIIQILYARGLYLTYDSYSGIVYYSTDGITWHKNDNIVCVETFKSLEYANGLWVANTASGLQYSTDGINWTRSNITKTSYNEIYYINDTWFTFGYYNNSYNYYYSADGINWFKCSYIYCRTIKNNHGIWLNCNADTIQYSLDYVNWNMALRNVFANELLCEDNIWLASYAMPYNYNYNGTQSNMGIWYSKVWENPNVEEVIMETETTETE